MCKNSEERTVSAMPNAGEIIERLAGELEIYRLFAYSHGLFTREDVEKAVHQMLAKPDAEED
ncbi:MAG: hypothetical protein FWC27_02785 [Firmicutes bacterium]|nr:hypothetical protein [Bacillota bacterium]